MRKITQTLQVLAFALSCGLATGLGFLLGGYVLPFAYGLIGYPRVILFRDYPGGRIILNLVVVALAALVGSASLLAGRRTGIVKAIQARRITWRTALSLVVLAFLLSIATRITFSVLFDFIPPPLRSSPWSSDGKQGIDALFLVACVQRLPGDAIL